MSENENNERRERSKTVIPLSNDQFRYVEKERNEQGKYVITRDESYKEVKTSYFCAAEEDVAAKAIRDFTRKGPSTTYVKTSDNTENQKEE